MRCTFRRFDLSQTDVSGNDRQDVVKIVGDPSGERPERFELAGSEPFLLNPLPIRYISKEDGHPAATWINKQLVPNSAGQVADVEFDRHLLGHRAPIILFRVIGG